MADEVMEDRIESGDCADYEGWFSRLLCPECQEMFEVEDDVTNGQEVTCDACNWSGPVRRGI